jgi:hypothetical protein
MPPVATTCLVLTLLAQGPVVPAREPKTGEGLPDSFKGWSVRAPESIDWARAGYSPADWYVRIGGGRVLVFDRPQEDADILPFKIKPVPKQGETDLAGDRQVVKVEGGYLVGFNAGEFGGGAWWFSADGSRRRKLTIRKSEAPGDYVAENVRAFATVGKDVLAFEGLNHLSANDGQVVRLRRSGNGQWRVWAFTDLPACPHAVLQDGDSSWLLATTEGILRVDANGGVKSLWQPSWGHLYYPNSLVRDTTGALYMGMRTFVVRLRPSSSTEYLVDVLVPPQKR